MHVVIVMPGVRHSYVSDADTRVISNIPDNIYKPRGLTVRKITLVGLKREDLLPVLAQGLQMACLTVEHQTGTPVQYIEEAGDTNE